VVRQFDREQQTGHRTRTVDGLAVRHPGMHAVLVRNHEPQVPSASTTFIRPTVTSSNLPVTVSRRNAGAGHEQHERAGDSVDAENAQFATNRPAHGSPHWCVNEGSQYTAATTTARCGLVFAHWALLQHPRYRAGRVEGRGASVATDQIS